MTACLLFASAAAANAQPMPLIISDPDRLGEAELWPSFGITVWQVPALHDLSWYIAYDATPLTVDLPEFAIHLVNDGRPLQTLLATPGVTAELKYTLSRVDRHTRLVDGASVDVHLYPGEERVVARGRSIASAHLTLIEHAGRLDPGAYVLQLSLHSTGPLRCAVDDRLLTEALSLALPPLRFEVIEHPLPDPDGGSDALTLEPATELDQLTGRRRAWFTNTLDVPVTLAADLGFRQGREPVADDFPLSVYNDIEQWTEKGWSRDGTMGYCGVGMGHVTIRPGERVSIALTSPQTLSRRTGVYRCILAVTTPDGDRREFATSPLTVRHSADE